MTPAWAADQPEMRVGMLTNALLRDVRFLSAICLHTGCMTLEESEKMFREKAFADAGNARQQALRGTYDPGYLAYTLGKLMIRKLRSRLAGGQSGRHAPAVPRPLPVVRLAAGSRGSRADARNAAAVLCSPRTNYRALARRQGGFCASQQGAAQASEPAWGARVLTRCDVRWTRAMPAHRCFCRLHFCTISTHVGTHRQRVGIEAEGTSYGKGAR